MLQQKYPGLNSYPEVVGGTPGSGKWDGKHIVVPESFFHSISGFDADDFVRTIIHEAIHATPNLEEELNPRHDPIHHPDVENMAQDLMKEFLDEFNERRKKECEDECPR